MVRFIEMVELLEGQVSDKSAKAIAADLRIFSFDDSHPSEILMDQVCGQLSTFFFPSKYLNKTERKELKQMISREEKGKAGIVLASGNTYLAMGQVIAGISCGGFERETELKLAAWKNFMSSSHLDNLFFTTISGDIGRTVLNVYPESQNTSFGELPNVDFRSLNASVLNMTTALVYGDMDGVILGTIMPMIRNSTWTLSCIFREYYLKNGISVGGRVFKASNRAELFGEIVSDVELELQSTAAAKVYHTVTRSSPKIAPVKCIGDILKFLRVNMIDAYFFSINMFYEFHSYYIRQKLDQFVSSMVYKFYKTYIPCTEVLNSKYTLRYFIDLVKELERETGLGVVDMTQAIVGVSEYFKSSYMKAMLDVVDHEYKSHFAWYVLRELVAHGFSHSDRRRELGVIEAGGDVVAIGHVLAGIHAGTDPNTHLAQRVGFYDANTLYGATVAGSLAKAAAVRHAARVKSPDMVGAVGVWDNSVCPPKYRLKRSIKLGQHATRAELLGDIDGFVLGQRLPEWLKKDKQLKLSDVLEGYYRMNDSINSQQRFNQFEQNTTREEMIKQTTLACKDFQRVESRWYQMFIFVGTSFCKDAADQVVKKFYRNLLHSSSTY